MVDFIVSLYEIGTIPFSAFFDSFQVIIKFITLIPTPMLFLLLLIVGIFLVRLLPL